MAYSHRFGKISGFIKFADSESFFTIQAKHFYTNYHAVKVGADGFLSGFNGQVEKFAVSFCDGAYRSDNFDNLYEDDKVSSVGWGEKPVVVCNYPCATCE